MENKLILTTNKSRNKLDQLVGGLRPNICQIQD